MRLTIDFETRSRVDLRRAGPWVYAGDSTTELICLAIKGPNNMRHLWINPKIYEIRHGEDPTEWHHSDTLVSSTIALATEVEAHNAEFERSLWELIGVRRHKWTPIPFERWRCSAAKAAMYTLPRSLEGACSAAKVAVQKDMDGKAVMRRLCTPNKHAQWNEDPDDLRALFHYCLNDVEAEVALSAALPDMSSRELEIWRLDQRMNQRGYRVDVEACKHIIALIEEHEKDMVAVLQDLTYQGVYSARQTKALCAFLDMPNMQKDTVQAALADPAVTSYAKSILSVRNLLSLSSTAKFRAMIERANPRDDRVQSTTLYHGASTGRWAGKAVQPQNFPRDTIKEAEVEYALSLFADKDLDWIETCFGDPLTTAKRLLRPMILAAPGNDLICADFAGIEARVLFWLARETEGLQMFRSGADIYCEMASTIYDEEVTKKDKLKRQVGKQTILGSGYSMSGPKFRITCLTQAGVELSKKMARHVIRSYRRKYPGVPQFWYGTEAAAIAAVRDKEVTEYGGIHWYVEGERERFLFCVLPSGRHLAYPYPEVVVEPARTWRCLDEDGKETTVTLVGDQGIRIRLHKKLEEEGYTLIDQDPIVREKEVLQHKGEVKKKWVTERTYGGKLTENIDQAISRDLMAEAMLRLERAGYPIILTVHDEIVAEVPKDFGDLESFERIMAEVPPWATDCPIAVEGWRGVRYRK